LFDALKRLKPYLQARGGPSVIATNKAVWLAGWIAM
jgi:hypothetical protein